MPIVDDEILRVELQDRLRYLTDHPLGRISRQFSRDNSWTRSTGLPGEAESIIEDFSLGLGRSQPESLGLKPFRKIILVTTESLSLNLMGGYNPHLREDLTPFYAGAEVRKFAHTNYWTSCAPTREGILATLTSHPNHFLAKTIGYEQSLSSQLVKDGFKTFFVRGDSKYYSPELNILFNLGFQNIIGKETFAKQPSMGNYLSFAGVPDYFVFREVLEVLDENKNEKIFTTVLTTDTHPGKRPFYKELGYPKPPEWLSDWGEAGVLLSYLFYHDHDVAVFMESLKNSEHWTDDILVILTADHCRPPSVTLSQVPKVDMDPLCRIPLIFLSPRKLPTLPLQPLASQIDLAPTILHLQDLTIPPGYWGRSLFSESKRPLRVGYFGERLLLQTSSTRKVVSTRQSNGNQDVAQQLFNSLFIGDN
ncbi:MAG: sulfatase-like hydrolase/transferase [Deltaproteobacteria bacterium]|jgi:phosphoglycerol transferase MdoB-like AlkP superfamily enzyme|nr:sulfatase-like hydrolase/transferase [Deltaproteobacteria bacterium]MBT6435465.1 sulfatase-like hydrolase/transferase [Deltaproteobacteria bacterium]MBT6492442.1 sulfatase-like hydrolase/transferase [Deltaproteobacteria bacterium]